ASMMEWEHLRHVPVEDHEGRLIGLVTHRALMKILSQGRSTDENPVTVGEVMETNPATCTPETSTVEAVNLLRKHKVSCLPGARGGPLLVATVGIHGNEPAGLHATRRVLRTLSMRETPMKGRLAAFVGNQAGLARNVRFVDEDMNRLWSRVNVEALRLRDPAL